MKKWYYIPLVTWLMTFNNSFAQQGNQGARQPDAANSKEVSRQMPLPKGGTVWIENESRALEIKIWDQPQVKMVTTVRLEAGDLSKDEEWMDKINLSMKTSGNGIRILSKASYSAYAVGGAADQSTSFTLTGAVRSNAINKPGKQMLTIYVPGDAKVEVDNKYGDLKFTGELKELSLITSNANVDIERTGKLYLRSKYGNVMTGDVKDATVELMNGRFTANQVGQLDIDTKYATVEMGTVKTASLRSSNDDYEIEEAGSLQGRKTYGTLRITNLTKLIDLEGANADVKIRSIAPSAELVKMNNKYAELRLPVKALSNYSVDMQGNYNTVYAAFEKVPVADKDKAAAEKAAGKGETGLQTTTTLNATSSADEVTTVNGISLQKRNTFHSWSNEDSIPVHFTAKVGNGTTKFVIACTSCTVDFK